MEPLFSPHSKLLTKIDYMSYLMQYFGYANESAQLFCQLGKKSKQEWMYNIKPVTEIIMANKKSKYKLKIRNQTLGEILNVLKKNYRYGYYCLDLYLPTIDKYKEMVDFLEEIQVFPKDLFIHIHGCVDSDNLGIVNKFLGLHAQKGFAQDKILCTFSNYRPTSVCFDVYSAQQSLDLARLPLKFTDLSRSFFKTFTNEVNSRTKLKISRGTLKEIFESFNCKTFTATDQMPSDYISINYDRLRIVFFNQCESIEMKQEAKAIQKVDCGRNIHFDFSTLRPGKKPQLKSIFADLSSIGKVLPNVNNLKITNREFSPELISILFSSEKDEKLNRLNRIQKLEFIQSGNGTDFPSFEFHKEDCTFVTLKDNQISSVFKGEVKVKLFKIGYIAKEEWIFINKK